MENKKKDGKSYDMMGGTTYVYISSQATIKNVALFVFVNLLLALSNRIDYAVRISF